MAAVALAVPNPDVFLACSGDTFLVAAFASTVFLGCRYRLVTATLVLALSAALVSMEDLFLTSGTPFFVSTTFDLMSETKEIPITAVHAQNKTATHLGRSPSRSAA